MLTALLTDLHASLGWSLEALLRLVLAMVAGAVIGMEREVRAEHAGFRTLMLVCVGSALVMIISVRFAYVDWPAQTDPTNRINVDPGRIAYGVMTGIGFLGAGTIIERRGRASGLTTAAAIWCVAAIGMAIGFGLYLVAMATTGVVLAALWLMDYLEAFIPQRRVREITLRTAYRPNLLNHTVNRFERPGLIVRGVAMQRSERGDTAQVTVRLSFNARRSTDLPLEAELEQSDDYKLIRSREA